MPRESEKSRESRSDIFQLLVDTEKRMEEKLRRELLKPLGIKEYFIEGSISINSRTCQGVECKLCIDECPTDALFWRTGEVGITHELCIYCGACVLNCIVDDCIEIERQRETGEVERFSTPRDVVMVQNRINMKKRLERARGIFKQVEDYFERYGTRGCHV